MQRPNRDQTRDQTREQRSSINRARIYVTAIRSRGRITLPQSVRDEFGLSPGVQVMLIASRGRLELVPANVIPQDQLWCFTTAVGSRFQEAEEDVATGRCHLVDDPDLLQAVVAELTEPQA